ncbi:hypothetical protein [Streptomyces sp. SID13031]|uniref:hypothetical protein n=1 Tax=Streptomyces sp. SID13031 TaxID=2706046 RepID=UPI0013CD7F53|nr:hypothetical protein [Streptomyces sp. SID13031]NEA33840.1 hypothetical protein [Streptomyces sp. SID13031]
MRNKKKILVAAAAVVVIGAGSAFAYWSTGGSGSGTGSTSAGASDLTVEQTTVFNAFYPGGAAQVINGKVTNNAASSAYVNTVTASISSVTQAVGAGGTCDASDYTLVPSTTPVASDIAPGGFHTFTGATLKFNNKTTNQDGCKGATVNLAYVSN